MSGSSAAFSNAIEQQAYLRMIFAILWRKKLSILFATMVLSGVLAIGIQLLPKSYQGVASVEVLSRTPTMANPDIMGNEQQFTDETAGTELGIFRSPELRAAVIRKLVLFNNPEFNPNLEPSFPESVWYSVGDYFRTKTRLSEYFPVGWLAPKRRVEAAKEMFDTSMTFARKVSVQPVSHSKIIEVVATSHDPELAAAIANATVAEYVAIHQRQKEDAYNQAYQFASARLPTLRSDMENKSSIVQKFRQENGLVSGERADILREKLTTLMSQFSADLRRQIELRAQEQRARIGEILNNPAVLGSLAIQRLREQEAQIAAEGANKPYAASAYQERVGAIQRKIKAEADRIIQSLPDQLAAQQATVMQEQSDLASLQKQVGQVDALHSQLDPLENDAKIAMKQYSDFLSSDSISRPDVAFTAVNVRILSSAFVPYRASFPDNKLMLPAAFVLSFGCMTGLVLFRGRSVGFLTIAQIQSAFQIEPIGRVPFRMRRTHQAYWEAVMFLSMRLSEPYQNKRQTILLTSAQPGEGKTTLARSLAEVLAKRKISVILVDADMRVKRRAPSQRAVQIGLGDVLENKIPLELGLLQAKSGWALLPAGTVTTHPTSLIASDAMPGLLASLRATYDIVIIDGPPAPIGGDSWALSKLADRVLFVVKQSDTNEQQIENAFRSLNKGGGQIDVVLNMVRTQGGGGHEPAYSRRMMEYYSSSVEYLAS